MSEENKDKSVQPTDDQSVTGDENTESVEVNRSLEEYALKLKNTSAENKKFRQKNSELAQEIATIKQKLQEREQTELEKSGKIDEAYKTLKTQYEEVTRREQLKEAKLVKRLVSTQLETKAQALGCTDASALLTLVSANKFLDDLQVDEDYNVSQENVKAIIERASKQWPYLFGKPAPKFKDATPGVTEKTGVKGKLDLAKASPDDIIAFVRANEKLL